MFGSKNNTMVVSTKHLKHASSRSPTKLFDSERFLSWNPSLSYTEVAYMLIVVAILLVLVYKHVTKPSWIPSPQLMSENFRLYMARSIIGDYTRWIFNYWDNWKGSRQDAVISNRDEKSRRLSLDMSSSSSTSLSPSVLPTHNASPRSYKKRPSLRQKHANSLSPIEDNTSSISSNNDNDSHIEHTEQDEIKTSVTIHVADTLSSRTDPSSVDTCQENKGEIDKISSNKNSSDIIKHTNENIDSWTGSQQTPKPISNRYDKNRRLTADLAFSETSISSTNNGLSKLQKKNSLKENRKQNSRNNKEQTIVLATQESDGEVDSIISDDHSDSLIQQSDATVSSIQKHEETFVKTGHKRRRRRTKSKNNQQKAQQNQQPQNSDQRSSKQEQSVSPQKQDISQQSSSDTSKSRHHHSNEASKSRQSVEKSKTNYDIWERHPHQQHVESHQSRSDQTVYFLQDNKRTSQIYHSTNLNSTAIPAKATLPESNRKAAVFPRTDNIHWKPPHTSTVSHNFNPIITSSNAPISRFASYADVIAPHNRSSRSNTSGLSNGNNIATPVPVVSMNNATNQWYSPFESGLSIQLTPPASPRDTHRHLPSTNSNAPSSVYSKQSQGRNRNVIAPPPSLPASNNISLFSSSSSSPSSSLSMFTSSPFPSFSNSLSNQNQSNNVITNSSFRESLFGRKHVQDQEKGEFSDKADNSGSWNKIIGVSELGNQRTQNDDALLVRKGKFGEGTKNENISNQPQFSLFDKRL